MLPTLENIIEQNANLRKKILELDTEGGNKKILSLVSGLESVNMEIKKIINSVKGEK